MRSAIVLLFTLSFSSIFAKECSLLVKIKPLSLTCDENNSHKSDPSFKLSFDIEHFEQLFTKDDLYASIEDPIHKATKLIVPLDKKLKLYGCPDVMAINLIDAVSKEEGLKDQSEANMIWGIIYDLSVGFKYFYNGKYNDEKKELIYFFDDVPCEEKLPRFKMALPSPSYIKGKYGFYNTAVKFNFVSSSTHEDQGYWQGVPEDYLMKEYQDLLRVRAQANKI